MLAPIAERALSPADWAAVRELEDGVGWALIAAATGRRPAAASGLRRRRLRAQHGR